jgi:glucose-6-phosphate 1-dehydrogenase
MNAEPVQPHLFVILGATGNLAQRRLFPALYSLLNQKKLKKSCRVLGVGTKDIGDENFQKGIEDALGKAGFSSEEAHLWCRTAVHYQTVDKSSTGFSGLAGQIRELEAQWAFPGNRVFYLALPPSELSGAIQGIGQERLHGSPGWVRVIVEKPFGRDHSSAQSLNQLAHRYFDESQIFRIDHYLGKETVQNLLFFRFANTIFESLWNRDKIDSIEITVAESMGLERRARYYEQAGALRDIVQNHLLQLLSLVAMEVPSTFEADDIRDEKVKVLHSISELDPERAVFGQYTKGEIGGQVVPGYLEEPGVAADSTVETYVAFQLQIDNWRWQGVPFFLRTGKRLAQRLTQIIINFREPPVNLFKHYEACQVHANRLLIAVQPKEGFHLFFDVKEPGESLGLRTEKLQFRYADSFDRLPEAYQTLIYDILRGDQTLFVRSDEVESAWKLLTPLIDIKLPVHSYSAGSWGPSEAETLLSRKARSWTNLQAD